MSKEKWAQDVHPEKGEMHKLLGVPQGETVKSHYKSGESLAKALVHKVGKEHASHMLALPANANPENDIYDAARNYIKDHMNESKEESALRQEIRKILESSLDETDLVSKSKQDWENQKSELKHEMALLIADLEKDAYKQGVEVINKVIKGLNTWKTKITKNI